MSGSTRREFFEESMIAAGVLAASQMQAQTLFAEETTQTAVNETIRHAVIGCRIRGKVHAREFAKLKSDPRMRPGKWATSTRMEWSASLSSCYWLRTSSSKLIDAAIKNCCTLA